MIKSVNFKLVIFVFLFLVMLIDLKAQIVPPIYVVIFTHIEDNTPTGVLGTTEARQNYILWRNRLITLGNLFFQYKAKWVLEPDWKFLLAALNYEDSTLTSNTNKKNLFRYLKEDLNVAIDPHSHEKQGFNYTDVAHLLDSLGVGGSTVIGGHVWDPNLPEFAEWDRFRVPVAGSKFPWAVWRGDILMGSATPNHINDPHISGVWRPKDRYHFWEDDPLGNIVCIGQYKNSDKAYFNEFIKNINELGDLYRTGKVATKFMLTIYKHLTPAEISAPKMLQSIEDSLLKPLLQLQSMGRLKLTDFTSLIADWKTLFNSQAFIYNPDFPSAIENTLGLFSDITLFEIYPNPFNSETSIHFELITDAKIVLKITNLFGQEIETLLEKDLSAGKYSLNFKPDYLTDGVYFCYLSNGIFIISKKIVFIR